MATNTERITALETSVALLTAENKARLTTINAQNVVIAELRPRLVALEEEMKKLRGTAPAPAPVPTPVPAPPPPAPSPIPVPVPPPAIAAPFLTKPSITGSKVLGSGVLTRVSATAAAGWSGYQGRWYLDGQTAELGGAATLSLSALAPGNKVVFKEWFRNAAGAEASISSDPFGPMASAVLVTGTAQL